MQSITTQWSFAALFTLSMLCLSWAHAKEIQGSKSKCDPTNEVACKNHPSICVDLERIRDGFDDCPDASDEECGSEDSNSMCAEAELKKGKTIAPDRKRRFADFRVEVNEGQTTTFDLRTEVPTRPRVLGLITESKGVFVNAGTTTEYATQLIGRSIDGTYAKIQSTNSRIFSAIELDTLPEDEIWNQPTGVVSSSMVTRIRGETTTIETTQFIRSFIDETYIQEIVTASEIFAPIRSDIQGNLQASLVQAVVPTVVIDSSQTNPDDESGKIQFKTSHLTQIVGERVISPSSSSAISDEDRPTEEDDKKLISSFDEQVDQEDQTDDRIGPSTVKGASLPTITAGQSFDDLFSPSAIIPMEEVVEPVGIKLENLSTLPEIDETLLSDDSSPEVTTLSDTDSATDLPETENESSIALKIPIRTGKAQNNGDSQELVLDQGHAAGAFVIQAIAEVDLPVTDTQTLLSVEVPITTINPVADASKSKEDLSPDTVTQLVAIHGAAEEPNPVPLSVVVATTVIEDDLNETSGQRNAKTAQTHTQIQAVDDDTHDSIQPSIVEAEIEVEVVTEAESEVETENTKEDDGSTESPFGTEKPETESKMLDVMEPQLQELEASLDDTLTVGTGEPVTLLTTYTFFTTFFVPGENGATITSVNSREVVNTELVENQDIDPETSTEQETPALVTEDKKNSENIAIESSIDNENVMVTTLFSTVTYLTTFFDDQTTIVFSSEEVLSDVITVTETLRLDDVTAVAPVATAIANLSDGVVNPDVVEASLESTSDADVPEFELPNSGIVKTFFTTFTFLTTELEGGSTVVNSRIEILSNVVTSQLSEMDEELWESLRAKEDASSTITDASIASTPVADIISKPMPDVAEIVPEINPTPPEVEEESATDTNSSEFFPKTFYTTFTYFTTFFTEGTSNIVSHEETMTNIVTDSNALLEASISPVLPVYPVTYYTTFTYRTTSYSLGETFISTREETVSNIVTPGVDDPVSEVLNVGETTLPIIPTSVAPQLTTFYTTYTYLTTSFEGDSSIVSSSMETVTNIITEIPIPTVVSGTSNTARAIGEGAPEQLLIQLSQDKFDGVTEPIGLLSTIRSTEFSDGIATLFTTDILGTFINGQYAKILESSSEIIGPQVKPTPLLELTPIPLRSPTGILSLNVGSIYNVDNPTTTLVTSKAIGTYVGDLYAQLIETTTSLQVDELRTALAEESFKTGLVRVTAGMIIKDDLTTTYQTRVIGTFLNGLYAEVLESTSSILPSVSVPPSIPPTVIIAATQVMAVEPTDSLRAGSVVVSPSAELESSILTTVEASLVTNEESSSDDVVKGIRGRVTTRLFSPSRSRTFTPNIRPFSERVRPPLSLRNQKKRPPFPSNDEIAPSIAKTGSIDASVEIVASSTVTTRTNRFRFPSSLIVSSRTIVTSSEGTNKSRFFRLRNSSAGIGAGNTISPTPVLSGLSSSTSGRRGGSSINISSVSRSSIGLAARRSSLSNALSRSSSSVLSSRSTISVDIVPSPTESSIEEEATSAKALDVETSTKSKSGFSTRSKVTTAAPTTVASVAPNSSQGPNSRRFPLSRVSQLRTPNSFLDRIAENERDTEATAVTTSRPRFVRPPKVTFTSKPRTPFSVQNRTPFRKTLLTSVKPQEESVVEAPSSDQTEEVQDTRAKRQADFDYDFYDRRHYRRPSRGSSKTRTRATSDFDYDEDYDIVEELVFEDEVTTSRPRNSVKDRINAQREASRSITTRRPSSSSSSRRSQSSRTTSRPSSSTRNRQSSSRQSSDSSSRSRSKAPTTEKSRSSNRRPSSSRKRPSSRKPSIADDVPEPVEEKSQPIVTPSIEVAPPLETPLTVTHKIPTEATIPIRIDDRTEFKTIITGKPSVEIINQYATSKVSGTWRYIASEISATPSVGVTEITQFVIKGTETTAIEFTPTSIRGRLTSFSHVVPSTIYEIEPTISTISDPLAATNDLLKQLLLGSLGQGIQNLDGASTTSLTSYITHTSSFITTLTEFKSTKFPITFRGTEIITSLVRTVTEVITATEFSTETIINTQAITQAQQQASNPLASLLPILLQANPLLAAQLIPTIEPTPVLSITSTEAPTFPKNILEMTEEELDQLEEVIEPELLEPSAVQVGSQPLTSVVTLFVSGRRPGEFSSILSTIILDGSDASVVKRQTSPYEVPELIQTSALPFMVGTDKGIFELPDHYSPKDLEYYLMSAINEVGAEELTGSFETRRFESLLRGLTNNKSGGKVRKVRQIDFDAILPSSVIEPEVAEAKLMEEQVEATVATAPAKPVRRKTVTVTRKKGSSTALPSDALKEEFISGVSSGRKVIIVTRRKVPSPPAVTVAADSLESSIESSIESNFSQSEEKISSVVTTGRRRITAPEESLADANNDAPDLFSSMDESPLNGPTGNVYAPRTYYTVYSYFYTVLNGPKSGQLSTRKISISEKVRGTDNRIPSDFVRTENGNGVYTLSVGRSTSDLNTRIVNGITTQVNLASVTLVKYGRGTARASSPVQRGVRPTAILEPSFSPDFDENEEATGRVIAPTQKLPSARGRSIRPTRPVKESRLSTERSPEVPFDGLTTISPKTVINRGRGTVRFTGGDSAVALTTKNIKTKTIKASPVMRKRKTKTTTRTITRKLSFTDTPSRLIFDDDFDHEDNLSVEEQENASHIDEYDDFESHELDRQHDELSNEFDEESDDYLDSEEESNTKVSSTSSSAKTLSISASPVVVTSSLVAPTKSPIRTPLKLNTLESLLRGSLTRPRSSLATSSSFSVSSESPITSRSFKPFRSRFSQRRFQSPSSSLNPDQPFSIVYKTFVTTSTLQVDGRRSGLVLTLLTSSLTTLTGTDLELLTQSPELFKPVIKPTAPISRASTTAISKSLQRSSFSLLTRSSSSTFSPSPIAIESTMEDTTESTTDFPKSDTTDHSNLRPLSMEDLPAPSPSIDLSSSIDNEITTESGFIAPFVGKTLQTSTITVVETEHRTLTAVVTRKSGDDEQVTTRLQVLPIVVTRTIVQVQPTSVADVLTSFDTDENNVPTARAISSGNEGVLVLDGDRQARLNIGSLRQNLATKVMSNGVELIIAGDKKTPLLDQNVIQNGDVIAPSSPITLEASTLTNQVTVASDVQNVNLLSSIQLDPAQFWTQTQRTTFTYLTTLVEGNSKMVSSREEVITNLITQETGRTTQTPSSSTITLNSADFNHPEYQTVTYLTTFTYFNTFMDLTRPVVVTSRETVSNVVTVPVYPEPEEASIEPSFDTQTYFRTYTFTKSFDDQVVATSKEVVTQIVVTEAPIQATPVALPEVTKTYLNTVTILTTTIEDGQTLTRKATIVSAEVVTETLANDPIEATPVIEGSKIDPTEDVEGPLVATKTYFTTSTYYTTLLEGSKTVVQSRKEVTSSIVLETIDGFDALTASLFAPETTTSSTLNDVRPTYIKLGNNLYGKLRTSFATATYFITNSVGDIASKNVVLPQVTTETLSLESVPLGASVIEPSLPEIQATPVPETTLQLNADQLNALKQSVLAEQAIESTGSSLTDEIKTETPISVETELPELEATLGAPTQSTPGATVIMVTNSAGEVLVIPTEVLGIESSTSTSSATSSSTPSSSGFGGTGAGIASILGGLGTLGLTALGQSLVNNNPGGLNINLGPMFDAMTGILSNSFLAQRRNDSDPNLSIAPNQLNPPPFQPPHEPLFIPIGGLAGSANQPIGSVEGRIPQIQQRPPQIQQGFIPLRQPVNPSQRPPVPANVIRPPQPQPGIPIRTGSSIAPVIRPVNFQAIPGQPFIQNPGQSVPVRINFNPPLETGFTAMTNLPAPTRVVNVPVSATPISVNRPVVPLNQPAPIFNGVNNIDRVDPSRPTQQFFAANGQAINVPPLPIAGAPPLPPPPPPTGPQKPVQAFAPGAIAPGPDGKPVRIIGVPEGQRPPPGAEGQVWIRPVPEQVPQAPQPPPAPRPSPVTQPPRRLDGGIITGINIAQPNLPPRQPPFQPAIQTIASVEGENKIVRTNIVSDGQTFVLKPTEVTSEATILPSTPVELISPTATIGSDSEETMEIVEVVGNMLRPGMLPVSSDSTSPPPSTPSWDFSPESESGEASHTPNIESIMNSAPTEVLPSMVEFAEESWSTTISDLSEITVATPVESVDEPFGITSVIMGPIGQIFTTYITRYESGDRTLISTIIEQMTEVNFVSPSTVVATVTTPTVEEPSQEFVEILGSTTSTSTISTTTETSTSTEQTTPTTSRKPVQQLPTFPDDSPFNPPTAPSVVTRLSTRPTTPRPATTRDSPVTSNVQEESSVVFGGVGGIFGVSQPVIPDACNGQCNKQKQEICLYTTGIHQCVCRPGFSRANPSLACTKTYTYQVKLVLERQNDSLLQFDDSLRNEVSPQYRHLASMARSGLKQVLMKTDLSSAVQDSQVMGIHPATSSSSDGVLVDFFIQLDQQQDEEQLKSKLMKSLEATNFVLGDSEIVGARFTDSLTAEDFDECNHEGHHDCSEFAVCINQPGSYTCQCKDGFADASDFDSGRICLAETLDCEICNRNGRCVFEQSSNEVTCVCNRWFAGQECQVNLKVVMIVALTAGTLLILLITAIIVICCLRSRRAKGAISPGPSFLRYRGPSVPVSSTGTLDRTAMIRGDTSSESSGNENYSAATAQDAKTKHSTSAGPSLQSYRPYGETLMIPRAKHHYPTVAGGASAAERGEMPMSAAATREHQLIEYLEKRKNAQSSENMGKNRSSDVLSAGGRTSAGSTSNFRDSLENVQAAKGSQEKLDTAQMTVSEARSFEETTVQAAVRHPEHYYQSDYKDDSMLNTGKTFMGRTRTISEWNHNPSSSSDPFTHPDSGGPSRVALYTTFRDSDNSNFDSL